MIPRLREAHPQNRPAAANLNRRCLPGFAAAICKRHEFLGQAALASKPGFEP